MPSAVGQSTTAEVKPSDSVSNSGSSIGSGKVTPHHLMTDPDRKRRGFGSDKYLSFSRPKNCKDVHQLEVINTKERVKHSAPAVKAAEYKEAGKSFKSMRVKAATAFLLRF